MPRFIAHHLHFPHFDFKVDHSHNLWMLYGIRVLRGLIADLCLFFLPLYLFNLGPRLPLLNNFALGDFAKGMVAVGGYFALYRLVILMTSVPLGKLIATKIGFKNAFIISRVLTVLVFLLLKESVNNPNLIFLVAILDGIEIAVFWPLFYSVFGKNSGGRLVGQNLSFIHFLLQLTALAAPALGGIVAVVLGYENLFLFGVVLALISVVFALSMEKEKTGPAPFYGEFFKWLKEQRFRMLSLSYVGRYINDCALTVWPLYVFLILKGVEKVGYLYSLSMFISLVLSFFIGSYIDHHKTKKPYFLSGGFLSGLWFLRARAFDIWSIALVDVTNRLVSGFHWLFYDRIMIKRGSGNRVYPFFVYREVIISLAGVVLWSGFAGLFILTSDWSLLFAFGAVGILLSLLVSDKIKQS